MAKSDSYSIDVLLRPDNHDDNKKRKEKHCNSNTKAKALAKKLAGIVRSMHENKLITQTL
jgi:hypothetical protein